MKINKGLIRSTESKRTILNRILISVLSVVLLLTVAGCGGGSGRGQQRGAARAETPVPVITEEVKLRDLAEYIRITGKLEGITDITMISETQGRVLSLEKNVGDWIEKDEVIGSLDNEIVRIRLEQARAALAAAEVAKENTELNYRSTSRLYEQDSVSQAEYQQALIAYQGAVAQRDGAAAALESAQKAYDNSRLAAPVAGYISSLSLNVGETIYPNTPVAGIVNHEWLLLKSGVSENNILSVKRDQPVTIRYAGREYPARVRTVGVKPMANTSSYPVEIILDNESGELLPGMVAIAGIEIGIHHDIIYTETGNIRSRYDDYYVYTIDEDNTARRTLITRGRDIDSYTLITSGLQTGDLVVTEGIDSLDDGMKVNIREQE